MRAASMGGILAVVALAATACRPFSGPLANEPTLDTYYIRYLDGEGSFRIEADPGGVPRDVYLTFVNPDLATTTGTLKVNDGSEGAAAEAPAQDASVAKPAPVARRAPPPDAITAYNQDPFRGTARSSPTLRLLEEPPLPLLDAEGDPGSFYDDLEIARDAHCWKVVSGINVGGTETRTLNIWVADNCWISGGTKARLVDQSMVDALAAEFLSAGAFNDIYDWTRGMLGPEWGPHGYSDLIPANDEITIFLCDIGNDNKANGGVVGFFWSKDNFKQAYEPTSNGRVMFTIDAVMYANGDGTWEATDFWPEEIYSTLAHEFQHMIHFYQRAVLRNAMAAADTWINEMASQIVEDLLADKMDVIGPRGVEGGVPTAGGQGNIDGRLPLFNEYNNVSLTNWGGSGALESYSVTYAFGAWLARNYGGAVLLDRLMKCTRTGPASIEDIVSQDTGVAESFPRLLQRWSVAQVLSGVLDAPAGYRYNTGGFVTSTVNANDYNLGSINLFNYLPAPTLYTDGIIGTSQHLATSATLYKAPGPVTDAFSRTVRLPPGMIAAVLLR